MVSLPAPTYTVASLQKPPFLGSGALNPEHVHQDGWCSYRESSGLWWDRISTFCGKELA